MSNLWILFVLPCLVMAADQRTTVNFPANNNGQQQSPQQAAPQGNQANVGVSVGEFQNPNMGYYRNIELPPTTGPIFPPEGPNFYFNAGFNKALGIRFPDTLTGANYVGNGLHTPLGDLWAVKAELLPAIFKTGFFITAIIVIIKVIIFLVQAKHNFLLSGPLAAAPAVPAPVIPIVAADRSSSKSGSDESRVKRESSGSPVVDPETNFEQMLAQLDSIRSIFEPHN